jgi:hypothetical protein
MARAPKNPFRLMLLAACVALIALRPSAARADIPSLGWAEELPEGGEAAVPEETRRVRTRALVLGGVAAVGAYGAGVWWKEGVTGQFRTVNEGWFGQDTYTGGADKFGHAYATYTGTRLLARGFEWAGSGADQSLKLAALTVFGTMSAVEVMDGFSKKYRFSKEDFTMNALGVGLAWLFEKNPAADKLLDFRLQYWPSGDARRLDEVDPIADHSGQTYLLVAKAAGVPALRQHDPLRYFELVVGYGTRGYEPNDGNPNRDRSRHVYFGISLNLSEILGDTAFRGTRGSRAQRVTDTVLEFVQVPGTAALADHRL